MSSDEPIPVAGPWITDLEVEYVTDAARHAWYQQAGEYPARFEAAFAELCRRRHAVSLPSCTSGLHLALAGLGVGPGDEVVIPDLTWIASAAPITYVGATPVFVDVDPDTWCLDVGAVEAALTPRTKAVVAVDLYGGMPDYQALEALLEDRGVPLIEDAAEAVGSRSGDGPAGAFGRVATFSFHGSKTLTTGEGGMLLTDDDDLFARVMFLRDHGRRPGDTTFYNTEVAFKYKMSALQAALGLAQTERVDQLVAKKREIFGWYRDRLGDVEGLALNAEPPGTHNSFWMSTIVVDPVLGWGKQALGAALAERGIATRPIFHPLSSLPAYAEQASSEGARERNPVSYRLGAGGLNLPSALSLTEAQVDRVAGTVQGILGEAGPGVG